MSMKRGRRLALVLVAGVMVATGVSAATASASAGPATSPAALAGGALLWIRGQAIINFNSGKCLQPQSPNANARIEQRTCDPNNALQIWIAEDSGVGNNATFLRNAVSRQCMDLAVNSEDEVGNGTAVQQFPCSTAFTSEFWNRSRSVRTYNFKVKTGIGGFCLDVTNRSTADGALIQIFTCKDFETAQDFRFVDVP